MGTILVPLGPAPVWRAHGCGDNGLDDLLVVVLVGRAVAEEGLHTPVAALVQDDDLDDLLALDKCFGPQLAQGGHRLVGVRGRGADALQRRLMLRLGLLVELPPVVKKGHALGAPRLHRRCCRCRAELVRLKPVVN